MGEWKTAWDHIVFEGFLGVRMKLQFTWEGCDSALAAPLRARPRSGSPALALERGRARPAAPSSRSSSRTRSATTEHALHRQYEMLERWVAPGGQRRG